MSADGITPRIPVPFTGDRQIDQTLKGVVRELTKVAAPAAPTAEPDGGVVSGRRYTYPNAFLWWPFHSPTKGTVNAQAAGVENRADKSVATMTPSNGTATVMRIMAPEYALLGEGCLERSAIGREYLQCITTRVPLNPAILRVSVWVCPRAYNVNGTAFFGRKFNNDNTWPAAPVSWALGMTAAGLPTFSATITGGGGFQTITGPQALRLDEWTHVAGTYDGSGMRLHINALETVGSIAVAGSIDYTGVPAGGPYFIGNWPSTVAPNAEFTGYIEEPLIESGAPFIAAEAYMLRRVMLAKYGSR